jgi:adenylate cyclase
MLCTTAWLIGGSMADTGFDELRELAAASGDKVSLAMGMTGWVSALVTHARFDEACRLSSELVTLVDSIGDTDLTLGLLYGPVVAKYLAGEETEALRLAQRAVELAGGDPSRGDLVIASPLAGALLLGGCARGAMGDPAWKRDVDAGLALADAAGVTQRAMGLILAYTLAFLNGVALPNVTTLRESAEILHLAERTGDDLTLGCAHYARGLALVYFGGAHRAEGFSFLEMAKQAALQERFTEIVAAVVDSLLAAEKANTGDVDGAIELSRCAVEAEFASGDMISRAPATAVLVESLLLRGADEDVHEAQCAIDRLAAVPTEPAFVLNEIQLLRLRALLAQARGDDGLYEDYRNRYRTMAESLGFEGHIAMSQAMA